MQNIDTKPLACLFVFVLIFVLSFLASALFFLSLSFYSRFSTWLFFKIIL